MTEAEAADFSILYIVFYSIETKVVKLNIEVNKMNWYLNHIFLKNHLRILETCLKHTQCKLEAYLYDIWYAHKAWLMHTWNIHDLYMNHTWNIHETYMNLTYTIHEGYLNHGLSILRHTGMTRTGLSGPKPKRNQISGSG